MKKYALILFLCSSLITIAQSNFQTSSYNVVRNDLETNTYSADSTANALVIYEEGNSYFDDKTFDLITEVKRKVKIFKKDNSNITTVNIYLFNNKSNKEEVSKINATTYNIENNNVTSSKLSKSQIFTEKYNDNHKIVKFTLPNIKDGSVITYSYTLTSPFIYKFKDWEFQESIPKLHSEYRTSIPGNYLYNIKLVGNLKLDKNESVIKRHCITTFNGSSADCAVSEYEMNNIPAFIEEEFLTSKKNYLSRIEYELKTVKRFDGAVDNITKTWKDADKELKTDENIGKQLNKSTNLKGLIASQLHNKNSELEKAETIYKYIQDNYKWNKKHSIFKDVSVKDLLKSKSGNVGAINILLHNLLNENNIKAKPVLLSTRKNGLPTKLYPVISEFNYLIVQAEIDGKIYLLDATSDYLSFGEIPFRCLNQYGRLLDFKKGSRWISLKLKKPASVHYQADLKFDENNAITGVLNSRYLGQKSHDIKQAYYSNPDMYVENFESVQQNINILEHEVLSNGKTDIKFQESIKIELIEDNQIADKIYLNPFIHKLFSENPFKLQTRTYPIDFGYKEAYLYNFKLDIGSNYKVIELPKEANVTLPNDAGLIAFSVKQDNNTINLFFKVNFKKDIYNSAYYDVLKKFVSRIIDIQTNSLIVLEKK